MRGFNIVCDYLNADTDDRLYFISVSEFGPNLEG